MAKRYYAIALALALCLSVVGCGNSIENEVQEAAAEVSAKSEQTALTVAEASVDGRQDTADKAAADNLNHNASKQDSSAGQNTSNASSKTSASDSKEKPSPAPAAEPAPEVSPAPAAEPAPEVSPAPAAEPAPEASPAPAKPSGYGRILFCGDSRSVDMFSESADEIRNEIHDGIPVYCKNGCQFEYMVDAVNEYGIDNFDTLVSWMGCNNFGNFSKYGPYYDQLLAQGKQLVLCTVGPTVDECLLDDEDYLYYPNSNQINFNNSLRAWANGKDVKIIDMYSNIENSLNNSGGINIVPTDGIHYLPQPTTELWSYILSNLK